MTTVIHCLLLFTFAWTLLADFLLILFLQIDTKPPNDIVTHTGIFQLKQWYARGGQVDAYVANRVGSEPDQLFIVRRLGNPWIMGKEFLKLNGPGSQIHAKLKHPLINELVAMGPDFSIVRHDGMDLCRFWGGVSSQERVRLARYVTAQLILAFKYLFSLNVVNCDVKLINTVINQRGIVKLIDFGLARNLSTIDQQSNDDWYCGHGNELIEFGTIVHDLVLWPEKERTYFDPSICKNLRGFRFWEYNVTIPERLPKQGPLIVNFLNTLLAAGHNDDLDLVHFITQLQHHPWLAGITKKQWDLLDSGHFHLAFPDVAKEFERIYDFCKFLEESRLDYCKFLKHTDEW